MPWLKFDEKQWEEIKQALERVISVTKEIQIEMKRANDLKERELKDKEA